MDTFEDRYGRIHAEIQENKELVKSLFESARDNLPNVVRRLGYSNTYFPTGLTHNGMYLGVDLKNSRMGGFSDIVACMRLLYEESSGEIDLLRVFALLAPEGLNMNSASCYDCVGIVSEDLSDKGTRCLSDIDYEGPHSRLLRSVFEESEDLHRCIFRVGGLILEGRNPQGILPNEVTRRVAADLDHSSVLPKHRERFDRYSEIYARDKRFRIYEH